MLGTLQLNYILIISCQVFQLEHNKIKRLPYDMCDMKALLKLSIHGNPLIEPPRDDIDSLRLDPEGTQYHDPEIEFTKIIMKHLKLKLASTTDCPDEEKERVRYELFELCPLTTLRMIGRLS